MNKLIQKLKNMLNEGAKPEDAEDIVCPICGYYCLGEGGMLCIDKPQIVEEQNKFRDSEEYLTKQSQAKEG